MFFEKTLFFLKKQFAVCFLLFDFHVKSPGNNVDNR